MPQLPCGCSKGGWLGSHTASAPLLSLCPLKPSCSTFYWCFVALHERFWTPGACGSSTLAPSGIPEGSPGNPLLQSRRLLEHFQSFVQSDGDAEVQLPGARDAAQMGGESQAGGGRLSNVPAAVSPPAKRSAAVATLPPGTLRVHTPPSHNQCFGQAGSGFPVAGRASGLAAC